MLEGPSSRVASASVHPPVELEGAHGQHGTPTTDVSTGRLHVVWQHNDGCTRAVSTKALVAWDALLRHDAFEHAVRKRHRMDGNPYTPRGVVQVGDVPERYRGRYYGGVDAPYGSRLIKEKYSASSDGCNGRCCEACVAAGVHQDAVLTPMLELPKHRLPWKTPTSSRSNTHRETIVGVPKRGSFMKLHRGRVVDSKQLTATTRAARAQLRQMVRDHRMMDRSTRRYLLECNTSASSSLLTSRSGITPSFPGMPLSLVAVPNRAVHGQSHHQHNIPLVEVYFEGEEQPLLLLRNRVHALDSVAMLRAVIDSEMRKLEGGVSLAESSNWTFAACHPQVLVWLRQLLKDFRGFYSDSEHSRYTGTQAKEMRVAVARHREQAIELEKYISTIRATIETNASVVQLFPLGRIHHSAYHKHGGLPPSRFFNGLTPQLPPHPPPPSLREVRFVLAPVMGAIRAQIDRAGVFARTATKTPPPTDCGMPTFQTSSTRVAHRLAASARRKAAIKQHAADAASGLLEQQCLHPNGMLDIAIPRVVLKRIDPSFVWEKVDIMMTQVADICVGGRGADEEEQANPDIHATEEDAVSILLGGAAKGGLSPQRTENERRCNDSGGVSPEKRRSTSPVQRTASSASSPTTSIGIHVVTPEEELERTLEERTTPLYRRDAIGWSNLDYAAWYRRPSICRILCRYGANPSNADVTNQDNVLHRFVKARQRTVKDLQCFKAILDAAPLPELLEALTARNLQGNTVLLLAVSVHDFVVVQALQQCVTSPRCRSFFAGASYPAADERAAMRDVFNFDYFVDQCNLPYLIWVEHHSTEDPANPVGQALGGGSLLHRALMAPPSCVPSDSARDEVVAWALTRVDPMTKDIDDRTAFHCAARSNATRWLVPFLEYISARSGSIVQSSTTTNATTQRLLVRQQSSVANNPGLTSTGKAVAQSTDTQGNTVLHTMLLWCRDLQALAIDGAAFVLHANVLPYVKLDQQNNVGDTILHLVMQRRSVEITETLCRNLKYESAISIHRLFSLRNHDGETILGCAIKAQFAVGIKLVLALESVAEVALSSPCSDDRMPLLLAVDVLGAREASGAVVPHMDQRPHCSARDESDCLNILLTMAEHHGLTRSLIRCLSGSRQETPLHAAVRHVLWHPSALLITCGASPADADGRGHSCLQRAFQHVYDTSLPRLLVANDTRDWDSGATLLECIEARGAASTSIAFMDECFLMRFPFPWKDAAFAAPFLEASVRTGNLMVVGRLLQLGARPSAQAGESFVHNLLDKLLALQHADRGMNHMKSMHFVSHHGALSVHDATIAVERLLMTMCSSSSITPTLPDTVMLKAVMAGLPNLASTILTRAATHPSSVHMDHLFGAACRASARGPLTNVAIELVRRSDYLSAWAPSLRRELTRRAAISLFESDDGIERSSLLTAVAHAGRHATLEAVLHLLFAPACNDAHGAPLHTSPLSVVNSRWPGCLDTKRLKGQAPHAPDSSCATQWLLSRASCDIPVLLTMMMLNDQIESVRALMQHLSINELVRLLLEPIALRPHNIAALGRHNVLRWALVEGAPTPLAIAAQAATPTPSHVLLLDAFYDKLQSYCEEGERGSNVAADMLHAARDSVVAAVDTGATHALTMLLTQYVTRLPQDAQHSVLGVLPSAGDAAIGRPHNCKWSAFECYLASPAKDAPTAQHVFAITVPHAPRSIDAGCVDALFQSLRVAARREHRGARPADALALGKLWDVMVLWLLGGLPELLPTNVPAKHRQSVTAMDQAHVAVLGNPELASLVAWMHGCDVVPPGGLWEHLDAAHMEVLMDFKCTFSLCFIQANTARASRLSGVLSMVSLSNGAGYLTNLVLRPGIPDCIVTAAIDVCRQEVHAWKAHAAWWLDHLLDVHHATNVRRVPIQTRQRFPVLSFMRDVSRSDPTTTHASKQQKGTALHAAVAAGREAVVVHMLQAQSRELDVNALDDRGRTALMCAGKRGLVSIASQLVSTGVDILVEDDAGFACLHHAANADVVELLLADDDGADAANSRSAKPHKCSPLMHHIRNGRVDCAVALLNSAACENCLLDTMVDGVTGETLLHLASGNPASHRLLDVLLERLPAACHMLRDRQGWTARDYCAPRSVADDCLAAKGIPRCMRLWPAGRHTVGVRDYRVLRHAAAQLLGVSRVDSDCAPWQRTLLGLHERPSEATMSIDERAWELASQGHDMALLELLELGAHDMQLVRIYGIPVPRTENDKRSVAKDINLMLQMRFGGCKGGCRLVFPDQQQHATGFDQNVSFVSATSGGPGLDGGLDPSAPYAAVHMHDESRIPSLIATTGLTVKSRPLKVIREPPQGPQYRTNLRPAITTLLHLICQRGCMKSLDFVLRNNASQGSPNTLICNLLGNTFDANGMSPFHLAVIHRQWAVVIELIKARVPLQLAGPVVARAPCDGRRGGPYDLAVTPMQVFSSIVSLLCFQWMLGGTAPGNPHPLVAALSGDGCAHLRLATPRFTDNDAEAAAYALMRATAGPLLSSRIQRIVLTSILDTAVGVASVAALSGIRDAFRTAVVAEGNGASGRQFVHHHVLDHLTKLRIVVDHEGADARDNASDRERTKGLLLYHLQGGVLKRLLEATLLDGLLLANRDALQVYGWVALLHIHEIRFMCTKHIADVPAVRMEPAPTATQSSSIALVVTFCVDANNHLCCPDLLPVLRDYFCIGPLEAAAALDALCTEHALAISILDKDALLLRRLHTAVKSAYFLSTQPRPDGLDEAVDPAEACWKHLRKSFEDAEDQGTAVIVSNLSITSATSHSGDRLSVGLGLVARLSATVRSIVHLLLADVCPLIFAHRGARGAAAEGIAPTAVHLGARCVSLPSGCNVTAVFFKGGGMYEGAGGLTQEAFDDQSEACVSAFCGLELLRRNWTHTAPNTVRVGKGLQCLLDAERQVEGEQEVYLVCPLIESIDDVDVGTTQLTLPIHGGLSLFRASSWRGHQVQRHAWRPQAPPSPHALAPSSRPPMRPPSTAIVERVQSPSEVVLSIHDASSTTGAVNVADEQRDDPRSVEAPTQEQQRRWCPPATVQDIADALQRDALAVNALVKAHLMNSSIVAPRPGTHGGASLLGCDRSCGCPLDAVLGLVVPFLVDPVFLWTHVRRVNRACNAAICALVGASPPHGLICVAAICARLRDVEGLIAKAQTSKKQVPNGIQQLLVAALGGRNLAVTDVRRHPLCASVPPPDRRASLSSDGPYATQLYQAFLANPVVWFQHVASVKGVHEASRLPPMALRACHRTKPLPQERANAPSPLHVVETVFGVLYSAFDASWRLHNFVAKAHSDKALALRAPTPEEGLSLAP